ncbi:MAG: DUF4358 domain-containing protein [Ruminococcus sp.]|nr:DUF4358 domain-containing protein [Ruminococcus sp.]
MKRMIALVIAVIMSVSVFAGCGGGSADLNKVMTDINGTYSLSLEKTLESKDDLSKYYSIKPESVKQFAAEINTDNNAPVEVVMIEATDADAATEIEAALAARYNSIVSQYASYTPEKLDMVKNCKVTKDGNYVSLIVADNAAEILKKYQDSIK